MADTIEQTRARERVSLDVPWVTLVLNDPVNLMTYVSYVFRSYFGYPAAEAERLMLQVHLTGRAVEAMHDYGLWATMGKADS